MAIFRLTLKQRLHEQLVENVFHFKGYPVIGTASDLADHFDAFITANWAPLVSSELKFESIEVQEMTADTPSAYSKPCTTTQGGLGTSAVPGSLAVVMSIRSGFASRRKNGRFYIAGASIGNQILGKWVAGFVAQLVVLAAAFVEEYGDRVLVDGEWTMGVWSNAGNVAVIPKWDESRFTGMKSIRVASIPGNQRRRRIGVGD